MRPSAGAGSVLLGVAAGTIFVAATGALLFKSAGRADLPAFWAYLAIWMAVTVVATWVSDPGLLRERIAPGPGAHDRAFTYAIAVLVVGQLVVAGLDVGRRHWSDRVPPALQVVGLIVVAASLAVMVWAMAVNRFFSSVIRIQTDRGHHLVTDGPYRYVRHPAYATAPVLFVGTGIGLGSWLATAVGLLLVGAVLRRTAHEDRILRAQLPGYAAYAERVRYRLLPGVW